MKHYKILICALLVVVTALGWKTLIQNVAALRQIYQAECTAAREKREAGLLYVALEHYQAALGLIGDEALWRETAEVCLEYYKESPDLETRNYVLAILGSGMGSSPRTAELWETAAAICIDAKAYSDAQRYLALASAQKAASEHLEDLRRTLAYTYTESYTSYGSFGPFSGGCFTVKQGTLWGQMYPNGSTKTSASFQYIGPANGDGIALYVDINGTASLRDLNKNPLVVLRAAPRSAGVLSEDLVFVETEQGASYISTDGTTVMDGYEAASNFNGGNAAVRVDGLWGVINKDGSYAAAPRFTDIKLTAAGDWAAGGRMLAKEDGAYHIYAGLDSYIGEFSCEDMDIPTADGLIAFMQNGLWGYVDRDGVVVIAPAYEAARSFSNGLGAVCKDGLWGFITSDGSLVIECTFADTDYFTTSRSCMVAQEPNIWVLIQMVA